MLFNFKILNAFLAVLTYQFISLILTLLLVISLIVISYLLVISLLTKEYLTAFVQYVQTDTSTIYSVLT